MSIIIGIPTLNGPNRLERCLRSIFSSTDKLLKESQIFVLDDCSTVDLLEQNKIICARFGVELLMHQNRMGVSKSWNDLVKHKVADVNILINDDIEVTNYWLSPLYYNLMNNLWLGVIGYQAFEGPNRYNGNQIFPSYVESKLLFGNTLSPLLSCKGFAFGFRREDFDLIGGFDEQYFCFFEEVDFNLSLMVKLQKRNAIISYPILYHGGAETTTKITDIDIIFKESKVKFENKWNLKWEDLHTKNLLEVPPIGDINEWNSNIYVWS